MLPSVSITSHSSLWNKARRCTWDNHQLQISFLGLRSWMHLFVWIISTDILFKSSHLLCLGTEKRYFVQTTCRQSPFWRSFYTKKPPRRMWPSRHVQVWFDLRHGLAVMKPCTSVVTDVSYESVDHVLVLLHPKLDAQLLLSKKVELISALEVCCIWRVLVMTLTYVHHAQELKVQEGGIDFMTSEYLEIVGLPSINHKHHFPTMKYIIWTVLDHAEDLRFAFKQQPCHLERLYDIQLQWKWRWIMFSFVQWFLTLFQRSSCIPL